MDCPICQHQDISAFVTNCPHCKADLTPFTLLDHIEERYVNSLKKRIASEGDLIVATQEHKQSLRTYIKKYRRAFALALLLPILAFWCGKRQVPPQTQKTLSPAFADSLLWYKNRYEALSNSQYAIDSISYLVREGDNLEGIGLMLFNDIRIWRKIKAYNRISNERRLMPGDTLILKLKTF